MVKAEHRQVTRQDIYDLTREELGAWLGENGQPAYRAKQVFRWLYDAPAVGFDEMTDLPAGLRDELATAFDLRPAEPLARSEGDESTKLLLGLRDGETIECVHLVTGDESASLCVSCQVGCAIRCGFCASGAKGLVRNLTAGEIIQQAVALRLLVGPARNIVFMGMGEPMLALGSVLKALNILLDKSGWGISPQRITMATSGVANGIRRYAREGPPTELAVSLNAPIDALRRELMPGARDSVADVLEACDAFTEAHGGKPVTYSYVLLAGVNDQPEHARQLAGLLGDRRHHVNLIPYNPVPGARYKAPPWQHADAFALRLNKAGLKVTRRRSKGQSIDAACGQLRARQQVSSRGGR